MRIQRAVVVALLSLWSWRVLGENEEAQAHYKKGLGAYGLGHYGIAAVEYEKAFAIDPQPALLFDAAQAHKLAGHNGRALELYQSYLRLYGEQIKNRSEVEQKITELKAELAAARASATNPPPASATNPPPASATNPAANGAPGPLSVTLRALTPEWKQPCPARLRFVPSVTSTAATATEISYRYLRSDRSRGKPLTATIPGPGTIELPPLGWTLGTAGKSYQGWMQVEIAQPRRCELEPGDLQRDLPIVAKPAMNSSTSRA